MSLPASRQFRKRQYMSSSDNSDQDITAKNEPLRQRKVHRGLHQSTSRKNFAWNRESSSSADEDEHPSCNQYRSSRSGKSEAPTDMGATATINVDTQHDRDYQAIMQKAQRAVSGSGSKAGYPLYSRNTQQQDALRHNQRYGPQRAPLNIRATTRWDYAPDICKDYKETGMCGFGDSCKFLHDRSDHKHGWQVEAEYAAGTYGKDDNVSHEIFKLDEREPMEAVEDEVCGVCRAECEVPVKARCGHFYCERCFLDDVKPHGICPVCNQPTDYVTYATQVKERR